ncbi:MAG: TatD family hydrolase [Candidatus Nanohaloarchaea archaeon]
MRPVDAHCHLDFEHYEEDREEVLERCMEELEFVVNAGTGVEGNRRTVELSGKYPEFVVPALGVHPTSVDQFGELDRIKRQVRENDPAAVGEIGLDHYHVDEDAARERQEGVFREMLELAEELGKPVVVHTRDAEELSVEILEDFDVDAMLHCFNGTPDLAERAIQEGMKIGVTTQVLYSDRVRKIAGRIPLEDLLLETDSPFLYRGERNSPVKVGESAEEIAGLKDRSREEVVEKTTGNAVRLFLEEEG